MDLRARWAYFMSTQLWGGDQLWNTAVPSAAVSVDAPYAVKACYELWPGYLFALAVLLPLTIY